MYYIFKGTIIWKDKRPANYDFGPFSEKSLAADKLSKIKNGTIKIYNKTLPGDIK